MKGVDSVGGWAGAFRGLLFETPLFPVVGWLSGAYGNKELDAGELLSGAGAWTTIRFNCRFSFWHWAYDAVSGHGNPSLPTRAIY